MKRYKLYYYSKVEKEWLFAKGTTEDVNNKIPSSFLEEIIKINRLGFKWKIIIEN